MTNPQEIANNLFSFYDELRKVLPEYSGKNEQFSWVQNQPNCWPNMVYNIQLNNIDKINFNELLTNKPPFWVVSNNELDEKIKSVLKNNGLREIKQWSGMALTKDMFILTTNENAATEVRKINSTEELATWVEVLKQELISGQQMEVELFKQVFNNPKFNFYGAFINNELVATLLSYQAENSCGLYLIATKNNFRKRGIASLLINNTIKKAFESGFSSVVLQATNKGESVYEKIGFKKSDIFSIYWLMGKLN